MAKDVVSKLPNRLNNLARWGLYGLGLQFVLGTIVSLWHIPPFEETATHKSPLFANISFDLHMFLALVLVIWSIYVLIIAVKLKQKKFKTLAIGCLISVVLAFLGGASIFYAPGRYVSFGLFVMGLGFIGAFFHYGRLFIASK